jgi:hypothetical protein
MSCLLSTMHWLPWCVDRYIKGNYFLNHSPQIFGRSSTYRFRVYLRNQFQSTYWVGVSFVLWLVPYHFGILTIKSKLKRHKHSSPSKVWSPSHHQSKYPRLNKPRSLSLIEERGRAKKFLWLPAYTKVHPTKKTFVFALAYEKRCLWGVHDLAHHKTGAWYQMCHSRIIATTARNG